jgi:hypothetical protein
MLEAGFPQTVMTEWVRNDLLKSHFASGSLSGLTTTLQPLKTEGFV